MPRFARTRLAPLAAVVALAAATGPAAAQPRAGGEGAADRLLRDIRVLASDSLEGRMTGTAGNDRAAAYLADAFRGLRLRPPLRDSAGRPTFVQRFTARSAVLARHGAPAAMETQNVVAVIPGRDPRLRGQAVVLGAHFDHLGRNAFFSTDPRAGDAIRNGADDNASGTAAVVELARRLAARPPRRTVVLALFSGEELGLLGSQYFVEHPPVPVDSTVAMLNFDMVGRLTDDKLLVFGVATAEELPALVDSANAAGPALQVRARGDGFGPSDHSSFYAKNVPVLHFFTDQHPDYHAATDDAEKINGPGTARVVDLAERLARALGDRPARLTFKRAPVPRPVAAGDAPAGPRPYLGSVPDMSAEENGLRLTGVSPGSPAEKGGLRAGDVVVELDGKPVTDLQTYSDALYARKPGDTITIVVRRTPVGGGPAERVTATVTLGRRGE